MDKHHYNEQILTHSAIKTSNAHVNNILLLVQTLEQLANYD